VLVVGDMMLDRYWFGDVERISPEAPVPVVQIKRSDERLGGAANVARNAAALGAKVGMLGVVGDDEPGRTLEALLNASHVQPYLHRDASLNTTIKLRVVAHQQQLLRVDFETRRPAKCWRRCRTASARWSATTRCWCCPTTARAA
jgi:rfaE bifunctional protein kinase chain/domain